MAAFNKFQPFAEDVYEGVHNLGANTLKVILTNSAPSAAWRTLSQVTAQLATGGGYTNGGTAATISTSAQTGGVYKLVLADVLFTAAGGTIGPFQYAILYNDTPTSPADPLIGWYDFGSPTTLQIGDTFTVDFDATNGVLQHS